MEVRHLAFTAFAYNPAIFDDFTGHNSDTFIALAKDLFLHFVPPI
jgi:hypothetical protein